MGSTIAAWSEPPWGMPGRAAFLGWRYFRRGDRSPRRPVRRGLVLVGHSAARSPRRSEAGQAGPGAAAFLTEELVVLLLLLLIAENPPTAMTSQVMGNDGRALLASRADLSALACWPTRTDRGGRTATAARKFAITADGMREIEASRADADRAMERLSHLGEHAERHRAPSIERAAMNLFTAVGQRMRSGGAGGPADEMDQDLPHRIAEILDEAARKIERL